MKYRVERKYLCSEGELQILQSKLMAVMSMDHHQGNNDRYLIRSIYFDNADNQMFYENDAGVDERSKFRIRAYNCQRDIINLEIKSKHNGYCHKDSFKLDENLFWKLLRQFPATYERTYNKTMNRFYLESATHLLRPAVIVEYERTAFVYPVGNVRVTFDRNIASSKEYDRFFDTDLQVTPILPVDQHILEVKYDEVLPVYLEQLLDLGNLRQCTFSKYYMARQLELQK